MLLSDLDLSIEVVHASFVLDLLHVQVKHVLVCHLEATHKDTLAKFVNEVRRMDQGETGLGGGTWGGMQAVVTFVSDAREFLLTFLRVRVGQVVVYIAG